MSEVIADHLLKVPLNRLEAGNTRNTQMGLALISRHHDQLAPDDMINYHDGGIECSFRDGHGSQLSYPVGFAAI